MPTIACPNTLPPCGCDQSPLRGLAVEVPDGKTFLGQGYGYLRPKLGNDSWNQITCYEAASAPTQQQADLLADADALLCILGKFSPPTPASPGGGGGSGGSGAGPSTFTAFNTAQSCSVNCPDGMEFVFTVPAGVFVGVSQDSYAGAQAAANTQASSYACTQASLRSICLSALTPTSVPSGTPYSGSITASGQSLAGPGQTNNWVLSGGTLPDGLTLNGGQISSNTVTITGTPITPGTYTFMVTCTDPAGDSMTKTFQITVLNCPTGAVVASQDGTWNTNDPPDAGYSTQWSSFSAASPLFINLNFTSPGAGLWTWAFFDADNFAPRKPVLDINGVAQVIQDVATTYWYSYWNDGSSNTPFATNGCVVVPVSVRKSQQFGGFGSRFEFNGPYPSLVDTAWFTHAPDPGYDTAYYTTPFGSSTATSFKAYFTGNAGQTWNWKATLIQAAATNNSVLTINGVVQAAFTNVPPGTYVLTGSFTPNGAMNTITWTSSNPTNSAEYLIEWSTPP